jgi:hypothetical protein
MQDTVRWIPAGGQGSLVLTGLGGKGGAAALTRDEPTCVAGEVAAAVGSRAGLSGALSRRSPCDRNRPSRSAGVFFMVAQYLGTGGG